VLKTIIVAVDNSPMSEQAIAALNLLKIEPETKIILSHVLPSLGSNSDLEPDRPHQITEYRLQEIEKQLHTYQAKLPNSEIEIVSGDPAEEIIRLANIHQADMIVIGSRKLKGFERIVKESVSDRLVADAPCSVLVVCPENG
jgi:nucleotide-binding universal stress UspA family protein